jgi:hypothetical protein
MTSVSAAGWRGAAGHRVSYNPPPEYLLTDAERAARAQREEEEGVDEILRVEGPAPQQFTALRHVPAYAHFVQERFDRCLDLYLAPRMRNRRVRAFTTQQRCTHTHVACAQTDRGVPSLCTDTRMGMGPTAANRSRVADPQAAAST